MFQWTHSKHNFFISTILLWQHLNSPSSWWLRLNASIPITLQSYKVKLLWLIHEITVSVGLSHRTFHLGLNNYLAIILLRLLPFLFSTLCYRNLHLFSVFTLLHWNLSQATMSSLWVLITILQRDQATAIPACSGRRVSSPRMKKSINSRGSNLEDLV